VRDHYGAATEGPRRPVMSAPHYVRGGDARPLPRPLRTTAATTATILWPGSLLCKDNLPSAPTPPPARSKPLAQKKLTLPGCDRGPNLKTNKANPHLRGSKARPSKGAATDQWH
jgi:hypothetical protein